MYKLPSFLIIYICFIHVDVLCIASVKKREVLLPNDVSVGNSFRLRRGQELTKQKQRTFHLQKTETNDIAQISSLLSQASLSYSPELSNWKMKIELLRMKSSIEKQLTLRLDALSTGNDTLLRRNTIGNERNVLNLKSVLPEDSDVIRALWLNDKFRDKMEKAAQITNEKNPWSDHNFNLVPENLSLLQHSMISVKCVQTSELIGKIGIMFEVILTFVIFLIDVIFFVSKKDFVKFQCWRCLYIFIKPCMVIVTSRLTIKNLFQRYQTL